jgi:hypothetical protein
MRAEHCTRACCEEEFETLNYRIRSTPAREWRVVVEGNEPDAKPDMRCALVAQRVRPVGCGVALDGALQRTKSVGGQVRMLVSARVTASCNGAP